MVYHACADPFWRMRQSILSNAPIYFSECLEVFGHSGIQLFEYPGYNTITTTRPTTGLWWHGGVRKGRFQLSDTTHSGTGEKETLNINVVGKKGGSRRSGGLNKDGK